MTTRFEPSYGTDDAGAGPRAGAGASGVFTILTVCTGNICRSPLAEVALRRALACDEVPTVFAVASAGTRADPRSAVPHESVTSAALAHLDLSTHSPRLLTATMLADADLVLGLSREHRRAAAVMLPRITRKTFTLNEFARIAHYTLPGLVPSISSDTPRARLTEAVRLAAATRGTLPALDYPGQLDVSDPFARDESVYAASRLDVLRAVETIADVLGQVARR